MMDEQRVEKVQGIISGMVMIYNIRITIHHTVSESMCTRYVPRVQKICRCKEISGSANTGHVFAGVSR
jgi:hypothetical protein